MRFRALTLVAVGLTLVSLAMLVSACGGGDSDSGDSGDSGATGSAPSRSGYGGGGVDHGAGVDEGADGPQGSASGGGAAGVGEEPEGKPTLEGNGIDMERLTGFRAPSGNIACVVGPGSARCDIGERDFKVPPKPADCRLDWGQGVQFTAGSRAELVCAGDTTLDPGAPVLGYGKVARHGPVICQSAPAGISCSDQRTGHGFFLSRERYELY